MVMIGNVEGEVYIGGIYDGSFDWDGMEVILNG